MTPAPDLGRRLSTSSPLPLREGARGRGGKGGAWLLLLLSLLILAAPHPALAHASLVRADPADGTVLAAAPDSFALVFNEPVSPLVLRLVGPDGTAVTLDQVRLEDGTLRIAAPSGLGPGTQALSWRVVSEDGHPIGGTIVFSVGAPSAGPPPAADSVDWALRSAVWIVRILLYAGLFLGIGGVAFRTLVAPLPRPAAKAVATALVVGLIAAPLSLGLQGLDALGLPLAQLTRGLAWSAGWATSYGVTVLVAALALIVGLLALALRGAAATAFSLVALLGVGAALALSGHASAAQPQWVTRPAVALHAIGIALWAGALLPLAAGLRQDGARAALDRFSRLIPVAVAPLAAAGIVLAVVQLGRVDALWTTAYGRVFLVKLALLAALFALAALNRWRLTGPARAGDAGAVRSLRRSITVEILLVLAIFGAAAAWRFTPPPRSLAAAAAVPASIHIHAAQAMADLTITPGRAGPVIATIVVMTGDFGPLDPREITLVLSNPAAGIEPIRRPATRTGDGTWRVDGLTIPMAGLWTARIDILITDFDIARLEDTIQIRP